MEAVMALSLGSLQYRFFYSSMRAVAGLRVRQVAVEGRAFPYLEGGRGPLLVLLHAFGDQKETWCQLARILGRHYTIIAPDLPGYGEAPPVEPHLASFVPQARWVGAFLDALGIERCHLGGNSMGGGISVRLAHDQPERVRSLSLLSAFGPEVEVSLLRQHMARGENPMLPSDLEGFEGLLRFLFAEPPKLPLAMRRYEARRRAERWEAFRLQFERIMNGPPEEGIPEDLSSIRIPALVMHGEADQAIPLSTGKAYAERLPQVRSLFLPGIGHVPHWEATKVVARAILEHLRCVEDGSFEARSTEGAAKLMGG
jgi:triacylglycerol lipase